MRASRVVARRRLRTRSPTSPAFSDLPNATQMVAYLVLLCRAQWQSPASRCPYAYLLTPPTGVRCRARSAIAAQRAARERRVPSRRPSPSEASAMAAPTIGDPQGGAELGLSESAGGPPLSESPRLTTWTPGSRIRPTSPRLRILVNAARCGGRSGLPGFEALRLTIGLWKNLRKTPGFHAYLLTALRILVNAPGPNPRISVNGATHIC